MADRRPRRRRADPRRHVGPKFIQIGTEGGFLPRPVVLPNTPVGYNYNRRDIVVLNVDEQDPHAGPGRARRCHRRLLAGAKGAKLILYNDAPAPVPAFDPRYDYYTRRPRPDVRSGGAPAPRCRLRPRTRARSCSSRWPARRTPANRTTWRALKKAIAGGLQGRPGPADRAGEGLWRRDQHVLADPGHAAQPVHPADAAVGDHGRRRRHGLHLRPHGDHHRGRRERRGGARPSSPTGPSAVSRSTTPAPATRRPRRWC